ncbi:MAG: hypothetical protein M1815_001781 [Lichina confinis]|nr:MAG: hypothetical protein M1815_001781 [Lichina confinis]
MPPVVPRKRLRSPSGGDEHEAEPRRPLKSRKPTLFDALDEKPEIGRSLEDNRSYLEGLRHDPSDSSLSDTGSSDFEDVAILPRSTNPKQDRPDDESDEDIDWEDAVGPAAVPAEPTRSAGHHVLGDVEVTLDPGARHSLTNPHGKKKGPSKIERQIRIQTHCMHVQFLMFHNLVRNSWTCDKEVQSILVKQVKPGIHKEIERWKNASGIIGRPRNPSPVANEPATRASKKRSKKPKAGRDWTEEAERSKPDVSDTGRGDPLIRLLKNLSYYWRKRFNVAAPGLCKKGYRSAQDLEEEILSFRNHEHDHKRHGERIRDISEFREHARQCRGSRDVGAQLFTALLRGLGLEARMVTSLQPIGFGWSKAEETSIKPRERGNTRGITSDHLQGNRQGVNLQDSEGDGSSKNMEEVTQAPSVDLPPRSTIRPHQGSRHPTGQLLSKGHVEDSSEGDADDLSVVEVPSPGLEKQTKNVFDRDLVFPIYWTEVLSPVSRRYIPVDPIVLNLVASAPEMTSSFEPRGSKAEKSKQVIAYVVGFSDDGTATDVTTRYLKRRMWPGKTKGIRLPEEKVPVYNRKGKVKKYENFDWFKGVMSGYARDANKSTAADDLEEHVDLKPVSVTRERKEGGETLQGYKNSADFVLERHLRREEALDPQAKHVKTFATGKGEKRVEEKVYRRRDVLACKTVESWHKEGREVKTGEQPLKLVPVRAVTLTRKRELEQAEAEGGEKVKQGLYARNQTDWIIPPPIKDGIIPRNGYGNIDCFVPSMVPEGAVHIQLRGMVRVCRRLNISHAEAVIGFDFGSQRAVPVIDGVVIAAEHEQAVLDAWQALEAEKVRKEDEKQEKGILALWKKFYTGLRIVERVRNEYGDEPTTMADEVNPFTNPKKGRKGQKEAGIGAGRASSVIDITGGDAPESLGGGSMPEDATEDNGDGGGFFPPADLSFGEDGAAASSLEGDGQDEVVDTTSSPILPVAPLQEYDGEGMVSHGAQDAQVLDGESGSAEERSMDRGADRKARRMKAVEVRSENEDHDSPAHPKISSLYWHGRGGGADVTVEGKPQNEQRKSRRSRKAAVKAEKAAKIQLQPQDDDRTLDSRNGSEHDSQSSKPPTKAKRRARRVVSKRF